MKVADIHRHPHAILQACALRLGNQPDIEEGLANAGLRILNQRVGRWSDALHASDKDEVTGSDAETPGALDLAGLDAMTSAATQESASRCNMRYPFFSNC